MKYLAAFVLITFYLSLESCKRSSKFRGNKEESVTMDSSFVPFTSPNPCVGEKVKFIDFVNKMKLTSLISSTNSNKKINLIIIDTQPIKKDTSGITVVSKMTILSPNAEPEHADKTLQTIKRYAKNIVKITHISSSSPHGSGTNIGYLDELNKIINKPIYKGAIVFFIMNNPGKNCPIEGDEDLFDVVQKAISNNMIVIQSAGNDDTDIDMTDIFETNSLIVGGASNNGNSYSKTTCSNYGDKVDVYGPSCIEPYPNRTFCESSSGSAVITALAVNLQYECLKLNRKLLTSSEMRDIFRNAPSELTVVIRGVKDKKIPQYDKLLKYAQEKYFSKSR
jgi:hypothetical protein